MSRLPVATDAVTICKKISRNFHQNWKNARYNYFNFLRSYLIPLKIKIVTKHLNNWYVNTRYLIMTYNGFRLGRIQNNFNDKPGL